MPDLVTLIQAGTSSIWLFVPTAILLGALHGLEPGHSKTMMAAFIIAVRGTVWQAVLLGLAATLSHTALVWAIALAGLHFGAKWNTGETEPYFQLVSAVLIIGVALWMIWRTWRDQHGYDHGHHHHDIESYTIETKQGALRLSLYEDGDRPRWRVELPRSGAHSAKDVTVVTLRPDGARHSFSFVGRNAYLESIEEIPEPHEFKAGLSLCHDGRGQAYTFEFHEHEHSHPARLDLGPSVDQDAHEKAHADAIKRRFANRHVTTGQIIMFGLTGGLIPCPASITVLLLCLQLKQFTLGATLVLCFSIGLAITMVFVGAAAAFSVQHVSKRWSDFGDWARRAPYMSGALIICVGLYTGYLGWVGLSTHVGA
jgi:nickel/cobalt exporter